MRKLLLLVAAVAACGHVESRPSQPPPDATALDAALPDSPPDASPDAPPGCHIATPMPPMWIDPRGFALVDDPTRTHPLVWVSNGAATSGSFSVAFADGDRITGLSFEARGNGSARLKNIAATYQPTTGPGQLLATTEDLGRAAQWGSVALPAFLPTVLAGGQILVTFDVTGAGYFVGPVTADLERACAK